MRLTRGVEVGEGYHIAGKEQCAKFCKMTRGCEWWTWYYQINQDDVTKASIFYRSLAGQGPFIQNVNFFQDNVCFALSSCELVTQRCEQCSSGKKVKKTSLVVILNDLA